MSIESLLFGFRGRLNRARYWLAALIYLLVTAVPMLFLFWTFGANGISSSEELAARLSGSGTASISLIVFVLIFAVVCIAVVISSILVAIRRLHDRDKSGWWVIFFYVFPSILSAMADAFEKSSVSLMVLLNIGAIGISIWAFVELGFLRGTDGPNRFGSDPINSPALRAARF